MHDFAGFYSRMETNEAAFCSIWADKIDVNTHAQLFLNKKMPLDYFYNRLNLYGTEKHCKILNEAEYLFFKKAMNCYVYVNEQNTTVQNTLVRGGFSVLDTMDVMVLEPQCDRDNQTGNAAVSILRADYTDIPVWVRLFCESFEMSELEREIQQRIELHFDKLILLISSAYSGTSPAEPGGCCALFAEQGVLGLYCLGTVSKFRGRGLARKMMEWGLQYTIIHHLGLLFLQTFESQNLFAFYSKFGFSLAYKKRIYEKRYRDGSRP